MILNTNSETTTKPNIIVILADDMGFSDIGCFGSEIPTPNLDRLARGGTRLTHMYNCARCCPSRASLLTGLYPADADIGGMVFDTGLPGYRGRLAEHCVTIAEALKPAGYRTIMSGKWHVGGGYGPNMEEWRPGEEGYPTPLQRGFDRYLGLLSGAGTYFLPKRLMVQDQLVQPDDEDFYFTHKITDHACEEIAAAIEDGVPFFSYVAHIAPHWPLHALEEDIARHEDRYHCGWDEVRGRRFENLRAMGLISKHWDCSPRHESAPKWPSSLHREWNALRMAVYAAQIDAMDQSIGRILDLLEKRGQMDNTFIIFVSDNGGCAEYLDEDGNGLSCCSTTNAHGEPVTIGNRPEIRPGGRTTFMSYDLPWANASNTPFRLFKCYVHEGGISTPCVIHAPGNTGSPGGLLHHPAHFIDIMPTCLDLAGASYPGERNGVAVRPLAGQSLLPMLNGAAPEERVFGFEHNGRRALRAGPWKLVADVHQPWELYQLETDRTELDDLAGVEKHRLSRMIQLYQEWASGHSVLPIEVVQEATRKRWR